MKAKIGLFIVALLLPTIAFSQAVAPPPQPLHLVDGHWTPYDPPSEFPEGSTVHRVVPGDTLWDLANTYLGDPYLWPQIWERNPYIKDSHWIYPGDPIAIDVAVQEAPTEVEEVVPQETVTSEYGDQGGYDEPTIDEGEPRPLGSSADASPISCRMIRSIPSRSHRPNGSSFRIRSPRATSSTSMVASSRVWPPVTGSSC